MLSVPFLAQLGIIVAFLAVAVKAYIVWITGFCKSTNKLTGKTVIITGANAGIGKETALDLAGRGARVIMACRDLKKAEIVRGTVRSLKYLLIFHRFISILFLNSFFI